MKESYRNIYTSIYSIISSAYLLLFISCNGQGQGVTSPENNIGIGHEELQTEMTVSQKKINDSLFYIEGQLCQHLRKIYQDSKGHLWFGTNVYGLMRYDGDTLRYFSTEDGFDDGRITGIMEDSNGLLWIATSQGVSKYDGKIFTNYAENDETFRNEVWSLIQDRNGKFWLGTNEGIRQFDGAKFDTITFLKAQVKDTTTIYAYDRVSSIMEDSNGNIWLGTDGFGISIYDGHTFKHLTKEDGLPDNNISDLMEDRFGNIWIGTMYGGVSRIHWDGANKSSISYTNFTEKGDIEGIEVGALFEAKNGNIWFAAENHGVYCYNGKSFINYNESNGLNTNGILTIFEDNNERFWFGGWGGLFRFDGASFFSVSANGPWN